METRRIESEGQEKDAGNITKVVRKRPFNEVEEIIYLQVIQVIKLSLMSHNLDSTIAFHVVCEVAARAQFFAIKSWAM